jgi:hypothetical protein
MAGKMPLLPGLFARLIRKIRHVAIFNMEQKGALCQGFSRVVGLGPPYFSLA